MKNDIIIKPNLFIVGAAKAATTSLHVYLSAHPDVYMSPIKEPNFFSKDICCEYFTESFRKKNNFNIDAYLSKKKLKSRHAAYNIRELYQYLKLYRDIRNERYAGESSVSYLYSQVAAEEIYRFNPEAKIIIVLRNPIERAFSHWLMDLRSGIAIESSFIGAVLEDYSQAKKGWGVSHLYIELGLYYKQVKRYIDRFPKDNVIILLFDELKSNPENFFKKLFEFLDISPLKINAHKRENVASLPKYPNFTRVIQLLNINILAKMILPSFVIISLKNMINSKRMPKLSKRDKDFLYQFFREDIQKLEGLIGEDLSMWKNEE